MNVYIPKISTEYVYDDGIVAFDETSEDAIDPTSLPINFAFVTPGTEPGDSDWHPGSWAPGRDDVIRCLVGPAGGVDLPKGDYDVWSRVGGASEDPRHRVGSLTIG